MTSNDCEKITQQSGSNFVSSFWFLPKEKRAALTTVYAYCRITDDLVDLAASEQEAKAQLDAWRAQLQSALDGKSSHPVLSELANVAKIYNIAPKYFFELADGMEMDLHKKIYVTFDELHRYCYLAASVVGLMCIAIFGYRDLISEQYAVDLGVAFQLTNVLRDIRSDSARQRVYLPAEDLARFGFSSEDFFDLEILRNKKDAFCELIHFECRQAQSYYDKARANLTAQDRPNFLAAEIMTAVYHSILKKVEKNPMAILDQKISLNKAEVIFRIFQGWVRNKGGL